MTDVDPTRISTADVYKGDAHAGTLTRERDDVVFRYLPDYLESDLPAIATTIPKRATPTRASGGAVPAFFAGLLPEGRRLASLQRALKTSTDDEFSQLIAVGRDCIGDVRIVLPGIDPLDDGYEPSASLPEEISFAGLFEASISRGVANSSPTIPGVQDKLSDAMLSLPVRHRGGSALLKLSPTGYPRLVENEAFFLDMAKACGLRVPDHSVIHDRDGQAGLVVERFDRAFRRGRQVRLAQEDAVQLAGRWPSAKYAMTAKEVFDAVLAVTPALPVARSHLLRLFIFSYLIANGDLHAKNVSVFDHPEGVWSVTPAYDLVSTLPYGDQTMALDLDGRDSRISGTAFVRFGERLGAKEKVVRTVIAEITESAEPFVARLGEIGLDERKTEHLAATILERTAELRK